MIVATRVEVKQKLDTSQVEGVIANLNLNAKTFDLGSLQVNYADMSKVPVDVIKTGVLVEVRGTDIINGVLRVSELKSAALAEQDAERIQMQGCVAGASSDSFGLSSVIVSTSGATNYSGGLATQMVNGTCIEAEGKLEKGGVSATHITLKNKARLESNIATVTENSFTLMGFGQLRVVVDNATQYAGSSSAVAAGFAAIVSGHHVKIRGRYDPGTATLLATNVEAKDAAETDIVIRNYLLDALNAVPPTITLMGGPIALSGAPNFTGSHVTDQVSFFNKVQPGDVVMLEGKVVGAAVTWNSINLED